MRATSLPVTLAPLKLAERAVPERGERRREAGSEAGGVGFSSPGSRGRNGARQRAGDVSFPVSRRRPEPSRARASADDGIAGTTRRVGVPRATRPGPESGSGAVAVGATRRRADGGISAKPSGLGLFRDGRNRARTGGDGREDAPARRADTTPPTVAHAGAETAKAAIVALLVSIRAREARGASESVRPLVAATHFPIQKPSAGCGLFCIRGSLARSPACAKRPRRRPLSES